MKKGKLMSYTVQFESGRIWHYQSTKAAHLGKAREYSERHGHGRIVHIW